MIILLFWQFSRHFKKLPCFKHASLNSNKKAKSKWGAYSFSSLFILDVSTKSQKDHKLFNATYNLCSKKISNKKIEGSPLDNERTVMVTFHYSIRSYSIRTYSIQSYSIRSYSIWSYFVWNYSNRSYFVWSNYIRVELKDFWGWQKSFPGFESKKGKVPISWYIPWIALLLVGPCIRPQNRMQTSTEDSGLSSQFYKKNICWGCHNILGLFCFLLTVTNQ